jgi:hypothetical protein
MSTGIQVSDIDITFFYPFYKYPWISNVTRIRTRGYKLISEFMPNKFFTHRHTDNEYPLRSLSPRRLMLSVGANGLR